MGEWTCLVSGPGLSRSGRSNPSQTRNVSGHLVKRGVGRVTGTGVGDDDGSVEVYVHTTV